MVTWTVSQWMVLGVVGIAFGLVGLKRGVNRELVVAIGVAIAIILSERIAQAVAPQANLFYRLGRFALSGGLTGGDPVSSWKALEGQSPLLEGANDIRMLGLAVFALIVALAYAVGQLRCAPASGPILAVLGLLCGCVNGFMVASYLAPIVFPQQTALIAVPSAEVQATLNSEQTIARVVLVMVIVLVALGLYSARRPRDQQFPRRDDSR